MEHNVYFDGKVQSLGFRSDRGEATVGVCEPGRYVFPTDAEEELSFRSGRGRFKLAGHDWRDVKVVIPAGAEVTWDIDPGADACYFCLFR
jgi:uncharacterized protein YaiE (UPF0345 family)